MSFGWGVGDIIAISKLAIKVHIAYKDAPDSCRHISEEVSALRVLIDKVEQHFQSSAIGSNNHQGGQTVLKGCQSVLEDLDSLIVKYKDLASTNKSLVIQKVKLGTEDIATLRTRLATNAAMLSGFIRRSNIYTIIL